MKTKVKTKVITLEIRVPADYNWVAQETWGELHLYKKKPKIYHAVEDQEGDFIPTYWGKQPEELSVLDNDLMKFNQVEQKNRKKTLRRI